MKRPARPIRLCGHRSFFDSPLRDGLRSGRNRERLAILQFRNASLCNLNSSCCQTTTEVVLRYKWTHREPRKDHRGVDLISEALSFGLADWSLILVHALAT
jgi:hypothetical protein